MHDPARNAAAAGLVALAVAMGIGRFAFTPLLPMMQADTGLSVVEGGWLAAANYAGYLVGALTALGMRASPARVIRAGLVLVGVSTLAMAFASHLAAALALRALAGVASAWVLVFASAWGLDRIQSAASPSRRALCGATLFAGVGAGIAVAGAVCAGLSLAGASSSAAWLALGALSLMASAAIWTRFADAGESGIAPAAAGRLAWTAETVRMVLSYGAFGFGYIIPATFISAMAREASPDPAIYGASWPAFGAAAAASTFAAARLGGRVDARALWIAGHVAMALGVVMPLLLPGLAGVVASALLVGGTFMAVTMVAMQEARRAAGTAARALIAAMTAAFAAGQIAGPLVVSALAARGLGYANALAIAAVLLLAGAAAIAPIHPKERSP